MTWEWSEDLVTDICDHLAAGKSLIEVSLLQGYPSADSMYRQMHRDEAFAARIARAREAQQDRIADDCVKMADEATPENWPLVRMRIWARQWRAAKLAPRRYGDKQQLEHTGAGGGPIKSETKLDMSALTEEQLLALASIRG